jgi:hypothetical protein
MTAAFKYFIRPLQGTISTMTTFGREVEFPACVWLPF